MTDFAIPHTFTNGTEADANQVNANMTAVRTFLNSTGVHKYQNLTIPTAALADASVTTGKIALLSVTTGLVADGAITAAKVAADVATQAELDAVNAALDARLDAIELDNATQTELDAHINDTAAAHPASAISIADAALDFTATDVEGALAELQADVEAVVAGGISDGSVTTAKLADSAVTSVKIADGTITKADLAALVANALTPTGSVLDFAGGTAPAGYLVCNGGAISRTTYADLFAVVGTTYGAGDGSTTFNLPDAQGRVTVGKAGAGTFGVLGAKAGVESVRLEVTEMPPHDHGGLTGPRTANITGASAPDHAHGAGTIKFALNNGAAGGGSGNTAVMAQSTGTFVGAVDGATAGSGVLGVSISQGNHDHAIPSQGGHGYHNNLQPYIVFNKIIKT